MQGRDSGTGSGPGTARGRVLLLAPRDSYRILAYLGAAESLGIELLVASNGKHSLISAVAGGLHCDLDDLPSTLQRVEAAHRQHPIVAVIPTDDSTVPLAAVLANHLGLPANPPEAAHFARRKDLARARLRQHQVPVPEHQRFALQDALAGHMPDIAPPFVCKPLALSGSRGVIRVNDAAAMRDAATRLAAILEDSHLNGEERDWLLVEAYLPGREFALEGMLEDGKLRVITLFDKPEPLEGPYFEESYYITPSRLPESAQQLLARRVQQACTAYGLSHGPVHAELRYDGQQAWIIEVAARTIGGQCARLLQLGAGQSLEAMVLTQAMGWPLTIGTDAEGEKKAGGVLMIPIPEAGILRRVEGISAAQRVPLIDEVVISLRDGGELRPLPEGDAYLGFIFAHGDNPARVEAALRAAHACLKIVVGPLWKIRGRPGETFNAHRES